VSSSVSVSASASSSVSASASSCSETADTGNTAENDYSSVQTPGMSKRHHIDQHSEFLHHLDTQKEYEGILVTAGDTSTLEAAILLS
jgi:hypothetical protein